MKTPLIDVMLNYPLGTLILFLIEKQFYILINDYIWKKIFLISLLVLGRLRKKRMSLSIPNFPLLKVKVRSLKWLYDQDSRAFSFLQLPHFALPISTSNKIYPFIYILFPPNFFFPLFLSLYFLGKYKFWVLHLKIFTIDIWVVSPAFENLHNHRIFGSSLDLAPVWP